jgi:hypothetical protein
MTFLLFPSTQQSLWLAAYLILYTQNSITLNDVSEFPATPYY